MAGGQVIETGGFRGGTQGAWPGSQWGLTTRESETLALLAVGMANRAIAEALFVSENTVRTHLKAVFRKLSVSSRSQAVARALSDPGFATSRPLGPCAGAALSWLRLPHLSERRPGPGEVRGKKI